MGHAWDINVGTHEAKGDAGCNKKDNANTRLTRHKDQHVMTSH